MYCKVCKNFTDSFKTLRKSVIQSKNFFLGKCRQSSFQFPNTWRILFVRKSFTISWLLCFKLYPRLGSLPISQTRDLHQKDSHETYVAVPRSEKTARLWGLNTPLHFVAKARPQFLCFILCTLLIFNSMLIIQSTSSGLAQQRPRLEASERINDEPFVRKYFCILYIGLLRQKVF